MKGYFKYIIAIFLFIMFFIANSCIEKFTPQLDGFNPNQLIVVEGQITDEAGPFRVKLSTTFEIDKMQKYAPPVYGADVQIFDDKGNQYQLFYTVEGWYETEDKNLKGVVGNTYTLNIMLEDGTQYESSPVLMQGVPEIDSVYFEETTKTRFEDGEAIDENWLDIYVDSKDPTGQNKYWKWEYEETWVVKLLKDSVPFQYHPEHPITIVNIKVADHVEETCWVTVSSKTINIASTKDNPLKEIEKFPIKSIAPNNDRLHIRYSILVKQTTLIPELYRYLKKLEESSEETGGIYEKIPEQIFGNISCCDNKTKALGYFSASAVKTKRIYINFYEHRVPTESAYKGCTYVIPNLFVMRWFYGIVTAAHLIYFDGVPLILVGEEAWTYDKFCSDCREYGTSVKPDFWED